MREQLTFHESLKANAYAPVSVDLRREDMSEAMNHYFDFLRLSEEIHAASRFVNTERGDGDFGQYERVAGTNSDRGQIQDNKEIFHFGAQTRQAMEARVGSSLPQDAKLFLNAAESIFWAAQCAKKRAVNEISYGNILKDMFVSPTEVNNDVLRFISYHHDTDVLAKGHFDRSVMTLAVGESHEGLRLTGGQNGYTHDATAHYMAGMESRLEPVEYVEKQAKFFLGAGWNHIPWVHKSAEAQGLPLCWHDVIPTAQSVSDTIARWAIVMFINPHLGVKDYVVPSPAETRPYKQLGRLSKV